MLKRNKHVKRQTDVKQLAHHLVGLSTGGPDDSIQPPTKDQISQVMAELGRRGGRIGGKRRLQTMTSEERKRIARKAAQARWRERKVH